MRWRISHRADPKAKGIADRHYNRQKPESPQFVPPGRCVVLLSECERALWVSSWPFAEYVRHAWPGAWVNSCFRNEGAGLSSTLIREAVAATRAIWGEPPDLGMVTFVDRRHVKTKEVYGWCYRRWLQGRRRDEGRVGRLATAAVANAMWGFAAWRAGVVSCVMKWMAAE